MSATSTILLVGLAIGALLVVTACYVLLRIALSIAKATRAPDLSYHTIRGKETYHSVVFLSDQHCLAALGTLRPRIECYELESGSVAFTIDGAPQSDLHLDLRGHSPTISRPASLTHRGPILSVAPVLGGRFVISASKDGTLKLWNGDNGVCMVTLLGHKGSVNSVCVTADGRFALSAGSDIKIMVWALWDTSLMMKVRPTDGQSHDIMRPLHALSGHTASVRSIAISPDGQHALSASDDRTVRHWSLAQRAPIHTYREHGREVTCVAFMPDARFGLSGGEDGAIKCFDFVDKRCRWSVKAHKLSVDGLAIAPDGRIAASAGADCTIKLWKISPEACVPLQTLTGHRRFVYCVDFSPDGSGLLSASTDKTVKYWRVALPRKTQEPVRRQVEVDNAPA